LETTDVEVAQQAHVADLPKELGFGDIVLAQIVYIVTLEFFGTAVKAGSAHVVLWLLAIVLFFFPQALVVAHLNRLLPVEGGLYEWARHAFGDAIGFLVAWNIWLYVVLLVAEIGLISTTYLAYAVGPSASGWAANKVMVVAVSVLVIGGLAAVSVLGLRVGKWFNNAGGILTIGIIGLLIVSAFKTRGEFLKFTAPPLSLFSLSVFSKMTFGALCGFEMVAIFAGESRNPTRNMARSVWLAAPVIALLYIVGTGAILAFVSPHDVNVIGPIPQALSVAFGSSAVARVVVSIVIMLLLCNSLSTDNLTFSASARLPLVAGWDHLLPAWFARLHQHYKTPINSILFVGWVTLAASLAVLVGVGEQEAFSLLQIWGFTLYGLTYLVMFAIPVLSGRRIGAGLGLRVAAVSGFVVTLLFVVLSVFPVIEVEDPALYAWKTIAVIVGMNGLGWLIYFFSRGASRRADLRRATS